MEDFSSNKLSGTGQSQQQPAGQNLGIAALITAIVTFVLAVVPCVGSIAIIPGIIAIVLASVGLSQATRNDAPRGIFIAGLIIAVVACMISFSQFFFIGRIAQRADKWPTRIEKVIDKVQEEVLDELEDANISIKIQNGDEKVEITTNVNKNDREKTLEELEKGNVTGNDTVVKEK